MKKVKHKKIYKNGTKIGHKSEKMLNEFKSE